MENQVEQILDKILEICNEKLEAKKQEHIFVEQAIIKLKEIYHAKEQSGSVQIPQQKKQRKSEKN